MEIGELEKVQARATKVPTALKGFSYDKRLECMSLTRLSERRARGDLIQMYKVVSGLEEINWTNGVKYRPSGEVDGPAAGLRGHGLRLERQSFGARLRNDFSHFVGLRHQFFTNRVVPSWNSLPREVVGERTLNSFKGSLDAFIAAAAIAR